LFGANVPTGHTSQILVFKDISPMIALPKGQVEKKIEENTSTTLK
jgi:hypothetical protein